MEIRYGISPAEGKTLDSNALRSNFLVSDLFIPGSVKMVYSHIDRIIVGGVCPAGNPLELEAGKALATDHFLDRRELGVFNVGGKGEINIDGETYSMAHKDALYVGRGAKDIIFSSDSADNPAKFYFNSATAHCTYPIVKISIEKAKALPLGSKEDANQRTIYQFIHPDVLESCQLCMGLTVLESGCVWNTMPCHTHDRRMEVYFYLDLKADNVVFHQMGEPQETRHIVIRNEEAVISPSWSIHSGVGTQNYAFIWGMVGENQTFTDMDMVNMSDLR
jgi:4-deoxy-L-threo-5-hexosulose-uronate ketol-isomerase